MFNRDLDDYIKRTRSNTRGKKGFELKFNFSSDKPKVKTYHDDGKGAGKMFSNKPKSEELVNMKKKIETTGEEIEELKEEEEMLENKRENMISRFFGSIFGGNKEKELPDEVEVVDLPKEEIAPKPAPVDSSVIEVMKISAKWLNKLDPETKEEFRNSQDFAKYKFLVDKINSKR